MTVPATTAQPIDILRRRSSEKWSRYPADVLPLFIAEMDYPLAPAIQSVLSTAVLLGDTGYANPDDPAVYEAFAGYAADTWRWEPELGRMLITTDVSVVIVESLRRLVSPGEGVIVTPPVYPPFYELLPEAGAAIVEVPLLDDGTAYALDLDGIDRALGTDARGVLLCNPHNPVGLVHSRDELAELSRIVAWHDGFVVSDEIHGPLTHQGHTFTPYLTVSDEAAAHGIAAHSASKAFNLAGLKCALFVTAGDAMTALLRDLPREVGFRAGIFGVLATRAGFADGRTWLAETVAAIERNVDLLDTLLTEHLPGAKLRRPDASFLAWVDLRALGWGDDPAGHALREAKVALSPGPDFGAQGNGHARLNLACSPGTLTEALTRLGRLPRA